MLHICGFIMAYWACFMASRLKKRKETKMIDNKLSKEDYISGVNKALKKYILAKDCPHCGMEHWRGYLHPYRGLYAITRSVQRWCSGKADFLSRAKKIVPISAQLKVPEQLEFDFN